MSHTWRVLLALILTLTTAAACGSEDESVPEVEIFSWWADGGEKAGLDALVDEFTERCPGERFVNGAVAGGAGVNAKQELTSRIQRKDPPDTFQVHAGAELLDHIDAGQVRDLTTEYDTWGLRDALPAGLVDDLTVNGKIYSVPVNVHRANVVWANTEVLAAAGITRTPKTVDEFRADLATLRKAGVEAPLALGRDWTQLMLLESVLISELGPDGFDGLFTGATAWDGAGVRAALREYAGLLDYSNRDRDTRDWPQAEQLLIDGTAAYQVMGDWEAADLTADTYSWFTFPGNGTVFQWLADSFVLATGAPNPEGTDCWLRTVGSVEGQRAFNARKGSIPARTDVPGKGFTAYQKAAMKDWRTATPVPSCAHGSACPQAWQNVINTALSGFSADGDLTALQNSLATAAGRFVRKP
ncbi:ABC transporter substrate-binding protein [Actinoplanes rectilineatus]|uniref:ABC transporter substrate-binding protein n=1 Tax=Actinoplanes rectilineatus TaxID=113571 RepID=UPI0005F2EEC7|nr:ABC transporter substrate-binding protein [Actinoplanes rectilineatus]